jgi:hypothetical protein
VRDDANGQALAYVYSRDDPTEAFQAKMLTKRGGSPSTSPSCRSYGGTPSPINRATQS